MFDWLFTGAGLVTKKVYFIEHELFHPNQIKVSSAYGDSMLEYRNPYSTKTFDTYLDAVRYGNSLATKHDLVFLDRTVE